MKRVGTITGLLLLLLLLTNGCNNERDGRRDINDSGRTTRIGQNFRQGRMMPGIHGKMDQGIRNGMMRGMGQGINQGRMRGIRPGMRSGLTGPMRRMPMDSIGWMPMGPGRRMLASIPNVTETQKKQISDLIKKHQDEMKKIREEMNVKMRDLRDSQKKDMLNILTDEQKKFIESGTDHFPNSRWNAK